MKTVFKILLWVAIIAAVIFLTLFISAKVGQFDSIGDMISFIIEQVRGGVFAPKL